MGMEVGDKYQGTDVNGEKIVGTVEKELTNTIIVVDAEANRFIIKKETAK